MRQITLLIGAMFCLTVNTAWADDFIVERATNLGQLDSWADISQFQWQVIDHAIQVSSSDGSSYFSFRNLLSALTIFVSESFV